MIQTILQTPFPVYGLLGAIILYGFFGSPTPDSPGITELFIGIFLFIGTFRSMALRFLFFTEKKKESLYVRALHILIVFGFVIPVLVGVIRGNDQTLLVRDLAAFSFLALPLCFANSGTERGAGEERTLFSLFPFLLLLVGILFSVRTLLPVLNVWIPSGELLYLSNSPLVLFAAVYTIGLFWQSLIRFRLSSTLLSVFYLGVTAAIVAAMMLDIQRATVGAIVLSFFMIVGESVLTSPRRFTIVGVGVSVFVWLLFPVLSDIGTALAQKTARVGFNMRLHEAMAVVDAVTSSPITFLFGLGWGASFPSPAVGFLDVNFTHSFLTTIFLKGGLSLLAPALFVCAFALVEIYRLFRVDKVKGLSVFWPFVIPVFLYASHKSLDFALILLLIAVWSDSPTALQERGGSCMKKQD